MISSWRRCEANQTHPLDWRAFKLRLARPLYGLLTGRYLGGLMLLSLFTRFYGGRMYSFRSFRFRAACPTLRPAAAALPGPKGFRR